MKAFLVIAACLALANCEAPLAGYQYDTPAAAPALLTTPQNILSGGLASSAFPVPQQYQQYSQQYAYQGPQLAQQYHQPAQEYTQQLVQQYEQPAQQFTQQLIQQYEQPAQQLTQQLVQQYPQPAQQLTQQLVQQYEQPAQQLTQQLVQQYPQPAQQLTQQLVQQYPQPAQQFTQQLIQQYEQPAQLYTTQQYAQQYQQPAQEISEQYAPQNSESQVAQVHKHVYVHVAPEDTEPARAISTPIVAPPQKHYKIIFIKTPSAASSAQVVAPQQAQIEEKTIVYVLSKKAEEQQPLLLPTPAATAPSKPEVYFIKYKTQKEQTSVLAEGSQEGQIDQVGAVEDLESVAVDSARSARPVPARFSEPAQLGSKYGTPEFQ